jgi:hypothetical protein
LEYKEALTMVNEQEYRRALDNLERLVIQCLFELAKLGMSGIGVYISIFPAILILFLNLIYQVTNCVKRSARPSRLTLKRSSMHGWNTIIVRNCSHLHGQLSHGRRWLRQLLLLTLTSFEILGKTSGNSSGLNLHTEKAWTFISE